MDMTLNRTAEIDVVAATRWADDGGSLHHEARTEPAAVAANLPQIISASASDFASAVAFAKRGSERKSPLPILAMALIRANGYQAEIVTTDLDREITVSFPLQKATAPINVALSTQTLDKITRANKGARSMSISLIDGGQVALHVDGHRSVLETRDPADFPTFMNNTNLEFQMPAADLLQALERTSFAISTEETRYYLNGVYMHVEPPARAGAAPTKLRFVATDGHRMAVTAHKLPEGAATVSGAIIPRLTVADVTALCKRKGQPDDVTISVSQNRIRFLRGNFVVLSKLVDGTFPDYLRVMPATSEKHVTVDRKGFLSSLNSVSHIVCVAARLSLSEDRIDMKTTEFDTGVVRSKKTKPASVDTAPPALLASASATIPAEYTGDAIDLGFNHKYLKSSFNSFTADRVKMSILDPGAPMLVTSEDEPGFEVILMPMRI